MLPTPGVVAVCLATLEAGEHAADGAETMQTYHSSR